jgi:hypothetical protein
VDIDQVFMPVAVELIDSVFPTAIVYKRDEGSSYDPQTGDVTANVVDYAINAGVLSRGRIEAGGTAETYELRLWIQHSASGLPHLPTTADRVIYDGTTWKINNIEPTYSSKGLIASKITARNQ